MKIVGYILGTVLVLGFLVTYLIPTQSGISQIFSDFNIGFVSYIPPEATVILTLLVGFVLYVFIDSFLPGK